MHLLQPVPPLDSEYAATCFPSECLLFIRKRESSVSQRIVRHVDYTDASLILDPLSLLGQATSTPQDSDLGISHPQD